MDELRCHVSFYGYMSFYCLSVFLVVSLLVCPWSIVALSIKPRSCHYPNEMLYQDSRKNGSTRSLIPGYTDNPLIHPIPIEPHQNHQVNTTPPKTTTSPSPRNENNAINPRLDLAQRPPSRKPFSLATSLAPPRYLQESRTGHFCWTDPQRQERGQGQEWKQRWKQKEGRES